MRIRIATRQYGLILVAAGLRKVSNVDIRVNTVRVILLPSLSLMALTSSGPMNDVNMMELSTRP